MISHLRGSLLHKTPVELTVDVNGVGYQVFISLTTYYEMPEEGETVALQIHTHLREDTLKLFGFAGTQEKHLFEALVSISKVGPKLALAILSGMPAADLMQAVMSHDITRLSSIPGVGRKTAERLALEMKDKLAQMEMTTPAAAPQANPTNDVLEDALSALVNLGYKRNDAEKALKKIWGQGEGGHTIEQLIKESLNNLS